MYFIWSVDSTSETELGVIDESDSLVVILDFSDGYYGAERLLLEDMHAIVAIYEESGLEEVAVAFGVRTRKTSCDESGSGGDCIFDLLLEKLRRVLQGHGTHVGEFIQRVSHLVALHHFPTFHHKSVVHFFVHVNSLHGAARLSRVVARPIH